MSEDKSFGIWQVESGDLLDKVKLVLAPNDIVSMPGNKIVVADVSNNISVFHYKG